jgi:SNF2 family DNA or RNA helicase
MKLHPYQQAMVAHQLLVLRGCTFAPMGSGKTLAKLVTIDTLITVGDLPGPVLVLAPRRVAQNTWPDEARKWAGLLTNIEVSAVVGSAMERTLALRRDASVYAMNYENLPWLVEHLDGKWPFSMVVPDESTRLKSFRLRQGGVRTQALSQVSARSHRWSNLTGTPSPNGLADLWGQLWFCDEGARLGRSYTDFMSRWFKVQFQRTPEALPYAQQEIEACIADVCLSVDIRPYIDVRKPVVRDLFVELPAAVRAQYRTMERKFFMDVEGGRIDAGNAAVKSMKLLQLCLAAGTEVLTRRGWTPIEAVSGDDLLWDGHAWVPHGGLVAQGRRAVVTCWGIRMTPGHNVLTNRGWKTASEVRDADAGSGLDRASVRLPDSITEAQLRVAGRQSADTAETFDILTVGTRNQFVVRDSSGTPLVVHNCNGAAYTDEDATEWAEVHDAKLQALESVLVEACGAPVLVAYHFRSDLERMQRAFPQGRHLDDKPQTVRDWNAGKIPLLFAHPASAGHGLNLQDGGNILVYFGLWWNLEEHDQIGERIGPLRQAQSGHDRPVFVYRILARNTLDEVVLDRLTRKRSVQNCLIEAMKKESR